MRYLWGQSGATSAWKWKDPQTGLDNKEERPVTKEIRLIDRGIRRDADNFLLQQMGADEEGVLILLRVARIKGSPAKQLAVPGALRTLMLDAAHSRYPYTHPNAEAMTVALRTGFWWRTMESDCREWVRRCAHCQLSKGRRATGDVAMHHLPIRTTLDKSL